MGVLTRIDSGHIFTDTFEGESIGPEWGVVPNDPDRVVKLGKGVQLRHGEEPIYLMSRLLTEEQLFVLDVHNGYVPDNEGDCGGIKVIGEQGEEITLEEYFDVETNTAKSYPWIRLVREYNNYSAYWSEEGEKWHVIGGGYFGNESPKVGIFLDGANGDNLNILDARAFKRETFRVTGLTPGAVVVLEGEDGERYRSGECLEHRDYVDIDMDGLEMPYEGVVKVELPTGASFEEQAKLSIWGGDTYTFTILPTVMFEHTDPETSVTEFIPVAPNIEKFMGYFGGGGGVSTLVKMKIVNPFMGEFRDTTLTIAKHKTEYYVDNVRIAKDSNGTPGSFRKDITIRSLKEGLGEEFWVELTRDENTDAMANQLTFGIDMLTHYR